MKEKKVNLVFNTPEGYKTAKDSYIIRRTSLTENIPYYTTISAIQATVEGIRKLKETTLGIKSLQEYANPIAIPPNNRI